jgi:predicted nuclease of predicted toxin-antitoxin system
LKEMAMEWVVDENFPLPATQALRAFGHSVHSVAEQMAGATDIQVLAWARQLKAGLLSFDLDFGELIFRYNAPAPACVIVFRETQFRPAEPAQWLQSIVSEPTAVEGQFVIWTRQRTRMRALPQPLLPETDTP